MALETTVSEAMDETLGVLLDPEQTQFLLLRKVSYNAGLGQGKNEEETLEVKDNVFTIKSGATQIKFGKKSAKTRTLPIEDWGQYVFNRLSRDWVVISTDKLGKKELKQDGEFKEIADVEIRDFMKFLLTAANEAVSEACSIMIDEIPERDLFAAQAIINKLNEEIDTLSVSEFNKLLMELWTVIPRPMSQMDKLLAKKASGFKDIVTREQELFDFIASMQRATAVATADKDILEANGLKMRAVTSDEENFIKGMMTSNANRYIRAWKCTNEKTEAAFNEYCARRDLTEENGGITKLFHGSGTQNWWSIFLHGLYLNPELIKSDVRICGKMFGYGVYFAPSAQKSIGYTSSYGSCWANGKDNKAYLAIFKVATGTPYYIYRDGGYANRPNNWTDFHANHPEADCLWAERNNGDNGMRLRMDEVVIYQECQATIEYLIEFGA